MSKCMGYIDIVNALENAGAPASDVQEYTGRLADTRIKRDAARPLALQMRTQDKRVQAAKRARAAREKELLDAEGGLVAARAAVVTASAAVGGARRGLAEREADMAKKAVVISTGEGGAHRFVGLMGHR